MEKCSFCGGEVVNGRCQDCGMPYPTEKRYTLRGESAHTHEVNGETILHRVRLAMEKKPDHSARSNTVRYQPSPRRSVPGGPLGDRKKKIGTGQLVGLVFLIAVVINLLSMLGALLS